MISDVSIGQMDRQVDIEQPSEVNDNGVRSKTWSALAENIWAKREDYSGGEGEETTQKVGQTGTKFTIYNGNDVSSVDQTMRVKDGSSYFYIKAIIKIPGNIFLELDTEKRDIG